MSSGWHRKRTNTPADKARKHQYNSRLHKQMREQYSVLVARGEAFCWRCGGWIPPGSQWHVGHDDHDRTVYRGPEHARCNLTAAARAGNRKANAGREWPPRRRTR